MLGLMERMLITILFCLKQLVLDVQYGVVQIQRPVTTMKVQILMMDHVGSKKTVMQDSVLLKTSMVLLMDLRYRIQITLELGQVLRKVMLTEVS